MSASESGTSSRRPSAYCAEVLPTSLTPRLQWSHVLPNVETCQAATSQTTPKRFNGATSFRTWKPAVNPPPVPRQPRFNGATSFRTWKRLCPPGHGVWPHPASMEPRPSERGNHNIMRLSRTSTVASMEPRPSERGNGGERAATRYVDRAAMEPRPSERGNSGKRKSGRRRRWSFNGATSFRTWKRCRE